MELVAREIKPTPKHAFLFFNEGGQDERRQVRIAGTSPQAVELEAGKQYAYCACGRSEGQPFCDGSHKVTSFKPHVFTAENSETKYFCMCVTARLHKWFS